MMSMELTPRRDNSATRTPQRLNKPAITNSIANHNISCTFIGMHRIPSLNQCRVGSPPLWGLLPSLIVFSSPRIALEPHLFVCGVLFNPLAAIAAHFTFMALFTTTIYAFVKFDIYACCAAQVTVSYHHQQHIMLLMGYFNISRSERHCRIIVIQIIGIFRLFRNLL